MNHKTAVLVIASLLGCGPNAASVHPSAPQETPPRALRPDPPQVLRLEAVPLEVPVVTVPVDEALGTGIATPWAQQTADVAGLDLLAVAREAGLGDTPGELPVFIDSPPHRARGWTHTSSASARIYELLPIRAQAGPEGWYAVLTADGPPDAQIIDVFSASWILAIVGESGELLASLRLDTRIPEAVALWDVISTSVVVEHEQLRVVIEYSHAGSGPACEQRFTFRVRVEEGPRLVIDLTKHEEGSSGPESTCPSLD